ncbi:MAG: hypothetical protein AAFQ92_22270 [Bacteroidota bacterium]
MFLFCECKCELGNVLDGRNIIDGMAFGSEPVTEDYPFFPYQNLNGGSTCDDACFLHQLESVTGR